MDIDKNKDFSAWFNTVIAKAKLCDLRYNVKGFVVFMPWAVKTMKMMYSAYEKALEQHGHEPALFPALIPERNFKVEGEHVEGFIPEVFWIEKAGGNELEERLALRPTSETAMYQMYSLWIQGVVDLPLKIYHSCQVWRYETKATKPFIRSREFYWIESHNAFATEKEAIEQVEEDMHMAEEVIHRKLGIPFLFFRRPQWDKFPGAVDTFAADTLMPDGKVLQLPSTHLLGQNFSRAFNVKFQNEKGESQYVWQTCYGPAISRIYGALFSIHGDSRGIILPFAFAPTQIVIVPILGKGKDEALIMDYCHEISIALKSGGWRVHLDDSKNTPGFKYNHWELLGVPIRLEIGAREVRERAVTIVRRDTREKSKVEFARLEMEIKTTSAKIDVEIANRADEFFASRQAEASSIKELSSLLKKGMLVKVPFCSIMDEGKACADEIKEKTAGDVRGILYPKADVPSSKKCIACSKQAKNFVYVARQY